jgi:hypothetical protein
MLIPKPINNYSMDCFKNQKKDLLIQNFNLIFQLTNQITKNNLNTHIINVSLILFIKRFIQTFLFCVSDKFREVSKNLLQFFGFFIFFIFFIFFYFFYFFLFFLFFFILFIYFLNTILKNIFLKIFHKNNFFSVYLWKRPQKK